MAYEDFGCWVNDLFKFFSNFYFQATVYSKGDPFVIPASYFTQERQYKITVTAEDAYVKYTENFNVSVEFGVDYSMGVTPPEPVYNDRSK